MAVPHILVVDSEEGFGLMLKEGLENSGHYTATCVHTGRDALKAVVKEEFELVIIDMGLEDMQPATLVKAVRKAKEKMRIMLIPLMGQQLPDSLEALNINGVLTKPFFVGDLPDLVDAAIGRRRSPVGPPASGSTPSPAAGAAPAPDGDASAAGGAPTSEPDPRQTAGAETIAAQAPPPPTMVAVSQETIRFLRANEAEILRLLDDLNREVRAEAILLIAGPELIAQAGLLSREHCYQLAMLVGQSSQAAAQAADFLGEPGGHFNQSLHEGAEYRLYSLNLSEGILLSLALSSNVPLGMIRHQCRQIAEQLSKYII